MTAPVTAAQKVRRAARAALDKKAVDLQALDVSGLSTITDFFLVCSGKSTPRCVRLNVK